MKIKIIDIDYNINQNMFEHEWLCQDLLGQTFEVLKKFEDGRVLIRSGNDELEIHPQEYKEIL